MEISLSPELEQFIRDQIDDGKYASVDDAIAAGLQLLLERDRVYKGRYDELKREVAIGIEQLDKGEAFDGEEVLAELESDIEQIELEAQRASQAS